MRRTRPARWAIAMAITAAGLSACTAADADTSHASGTPAPAPAGGGEIPVEQGGTYAAAVADLGADQVAAAVETAARVARIALADCTRWSTGQVDPQLTALVTPELLERSLGELERSMRYGGTPLPALLSHLPEDDGNGHDLVAALARGGCGGSSPLHYPSGPLRVSEGQGERPGLVVSGGFAENVAFGPTVVSAGQDWEFTLEREADTWRLTDVAPVMANVNWALEMAD